MPKLIFLDMEGVIFEPGVKEEGKNTAASVWSVIYNVLGPEAVKKEQEGKDRWNSGGFENYMEWMEYSASQHQAFGLTEDVFYSTINKVEYIKGVRETIVELKKRGYKLVIISGGFKNLADRAIKDLKIDHVFAACEYFFEGNKLVHWNMLPCDYEGKVDFMRLIMREYSVGKNECGFVGDGVNDRFLAQETETSVAFNARQELQEACKHKVNQPEKDLRAILDFFPPLDLVPNKTNFT